MLFIVLAFFASGAFAAAGTVVHLSGSLSVQRPDGTSTILARNSPVNPGDVLTTQQDSYAQINFTDGSSITLRPNTIVRVEAYNFVKEQPQQDNSLLRLIKGGMRTVTGLIGRRGDQDAYKIGTQQATIGIRGSSGDTLQCADGCPGVTPTSDKLPPGLYHATHTGIYILQNEGGSLRERRPDAADAALQGSRAGIGGIAVRAAGCASRRVHRAVTRA
jgi:hypothetical protein